MSESDGTRTVASTSESEHREEKDKEENDKEEMVTGAPYHPQSQGIVERENKTAEEKLLAQFPVFKKSFLLKKNW